MAGSGEEANRSRLVVTIDRAKDGDAYKIPAFGVGKFLGSVTMAECLDLHGRTEFKTYHGIRAPIRCAVD